MKAVPYVCLLVSLAGGIPAQAQFGGNTPNSVEFRGRLVYENLATFSNFVIEVSSLRDRTVREHCDVMSDGTFLFRSLPEGDYDVRVQTLYGQEVISVLTSLNQMTAPLEIRLPSMKMDHPGTGTVSIQQLNHPPSKQVRKLLESGQHFMQQEHYTDAMSRFREAAAAAPECLQAHADLAMTMMKVSDWEGAATEFRAAVALDPRNAVLHTNLSAALASGKHHEEAGQEASTALKLDPHNVRAHLVLAGVLLGKRETIERAVPHLIAAQEQFPSAKAALEKLCSLQHFAGCQ